MWCRGRWAMAVWGIAERLREVAEPILVAEPPLGGGVVQHCLGRGRRGPGSSACCRGGLGGDLFREQGAEGDGALRNHQAQFLGSRASKLSHHALDIAADAVHRKDAVTWADHIGRICGSVVHVDGCAGGHALDIQANLSPLERQHIDAKPGSRNPVDHCHKRLSLELLFWRHWSCRDTVHGGGHHTHVRQRLSGPAWDLA
mmetsp:Transcript_55242/g.124450  ORF Transcript_55242/g.124450 Transcript_55242/m.124450 type:complete len:201 (-) Transcript_55242:16-618(-)